MQRIGYDADTQVYNYRDADGTYWEGEEGSQYGQLHRAGHASVPTPGISARQRYQDLRYLLPFFLIIGVVLLLLFRFISSGPAARVCPRDSTLHVVKKGDTCWGISEKSGGSVEDLKLLNSGLNCDKLIPGVQLCVPGTKFGEKI